LVAPRKMEGVVDHHPKRSRMNVNDLLAFCTIAQLGSATRAASQLNVAQSSLSRRLQRLEHHLGQRLLERHARGLRLTEAGRRLLERGETLNDDLLRIENEIRELAAPFPQEMRLAIPHGAVRLFGSALVARFTGFCPGVRLHLLERESIHNRQSVLDETADLGLAYDAEPASDLRVTPLLMERLLVVGPSTKDGFPVLHPKSYSIRDLGRLPLIMPGPRHGYRRIVERIMRSIRLEPKIALEVQGLSSIAPLVEAGVGYAISTYAHMQSPIQEGRVIAVPIESTRCDVVLALLERVDAPPSEARMLLRRAITDAVAMLAAPQHCRLLLQGEPCRNEIGPISP
jgi:LysR family nitrogen assimilation transcriptional regulator